MLNDALIAVDRSLKVLSSCCLRKLDEASLSVVLVDSGTIFDNICAKEILVVANLGELELSKTFLHFGATNRAVLLKLVNAVISGSLLEEGRAILGVSCNL
jgi:hypothetical protein